MRIAGTIFKFTTPLGALLGLRAAWLVRPELAMLMALLMVFVGGCLWATWRVARAEQQLSGSKSV